MSLTDKDKIIQYTKLPDTIKNELEKYIPFAYRKLLDWIEEDKYTELSAATEADPDRVRATRAESFLTCFYALPYLNLRPTEAGGFVTSTGFDASRVELMSNRATLGNELDGIRGKFMKDAHILVEDMIFEVLNSDELNLGGLSIDSVVADEDDIEEDYYAE